MTDPINVGLTVAKLVPWAQLGSWLKAYFGPRVAIIGPAAGGKSTFIDVINNQGRLVSLANHEMTIKFKKGKATKFDVNGPLSNGQLVLKSIDDTPGQKGFVGNVVDYLNSYKPRLTIIVVDASRPFDQAPELAEADTGKWFDAVLLKAQQGDEFESFMKQLSCVIVILNKFDAAHARLKTETEGRVDELERRLKEHSRWYEDRVLSELKQWFKAGKREFDAGKIHFFKSCLVTYRDKSVVDYDGGHLEVFQQAATCLNQQSHR